MVDAHVTYIIEEILTLCCPTCHAAFFDFDNCFAIKCGNCSTHFCGWCLRDCGEDFGPAHRHPRDECAPAVGYDAVHQRTPEMVPDGMVNNTLYGTPEQFEANHRVRKAVMVRRYLEALDPVLRKAVREAIKPYVDDLDSALMQ